jgi:hypothetical protein
MSEIGKDLWLSVDVGVGGIKYFTLFNGYKTFSLERNLLHYSTRNKMCDIINHSKKDEGFVTFEVRDRIKQAVQETISQPTQENYEKLWNLLMKCWKDIRHYSVSQLSALKNKGKTKHLLGYDHPSLLPEKPRVTLLDDAAEVEKE